MKQMSIGMGVIFKVMVFMRISNFNIIFIIDYSLFIRFVGTRFVKVSNRQNTVGMSRAHFCIRGKITIYKRFFFGISFFDAQSDTVLLSKNAQYRYKS